MRILGYLMKQPKIFIKLYKAKAAQTMRKSWNISTDTTNGRAGRMLFKAKRTAKIC